MKKYLFLTGSFVLALLSANAQYTFTTPLPLSGNLSASCEVNANDRTDQQYRDDLKRAVFQMNLPFASINKSFSCSGTLINRNTSQTDLGTYFITAYHCFTSGNCSGTDFDFTNQPVTFYFNFQSPPNESGQVFVPNQDGSVYSISRYVQLIDHVSCAYGDFAICKVLGDPIPAYFNVYYAGWYPTSLAIQANGPFTEIHHPKGDIKKITQFSQVSNGSGNVIATACHVVTKLIDFLFGWIWGHRWSTETVCTYLNIPYIGTRYEAVLPNFGILEDGSSGGPLLTGQNAPSGANRYIGHLSGAIPDFSCSNIDAGIAFYSRLTDNYYRQTIKNTMNPPNDYWVDQAGIGGRQITCYPQITFDATQNEVDLYPADLYSDNNNIVLTSQSTITVNGSNPVVVKSGANFTFQAGQSITLGPGFSTESGASFTAVASTTPCTIDGVARVRPPHQYQPPSRVQFMDSTATPVQQKRFDINQFLPASDSNTNITRFVVYPNPTPGQVRVDLFFKDQEPSVDLILYDINGKAVYTASYKNVYFLQEALPLPALAGGLYNLSVRTASRVESRRVIIAN